MESIHNRVTTFLNAMRSEDVTNIEGLEPEDSAFHIVTEIFTSGNCGNLAVMLSVAFGGVPKILVDLSHVVTAIDGRLYDITGDVTERYIGVPTADTTVVEILAGKHMMYDCYSYELRGPIV